MVKDIGLFTTGTVNVTTNLAAFDTNQQPGNNLLNLRRLNQIVKYNSSTNVVTPAPLATCDDSDAYLLTLVKVTDGASVAAVANNALGDEDISLSYPIKAQLDVGSTDSGESR